MENFTPYTALLGGALIGMAAVLMMLFSGRIAGVSGIAGGLLRPPSGDTAWRLAFVAGLISAPLAYRLFAGAFPPLVFPVGAGFLAAGGLLVGFGTQLGSGCTSGHGVCGVSRLSPRSLAATGVFMALGLATVFLVRHLLGA
jgi:uncharacterized membrane protein YedE/YeeE